MSITLEEIDGELLRTDSYEIDSDFVGVAVYVDKDGVAHHSGLVIAYQGNYNLFHYTGSDVEFNDNVTRAFIFKKLKFVSREEVSAFYAHCLVVQQNANPTYGYFFAGDYYNKEGHYFSQSGVEEYMTCVGFCISVIKGFIEGEEYFCSEDWTEDGVPTWFFQQFIKQLREQNPNATIDENLFRKHLRRISPTEYTAGAYLDIPVRKKKVDEIVEPVRKALFDRRPAK